ncbi:MAG: hypothetical protein ACTSUQ_06365 [Candidatus Freyarchaeota archaeon]
MRLANNERIDLTSELYIITVLRRNAVKNRKNSVKSIRAVITPALPSVQQLGS